MKPSHLRLSFFFCLFLCFSFTAMANGSAEIEEQVQYFRDSYGIEIIYELPTEVTSKADIVLPDYVLAKEIENSEIIRMFPVIERFILRYDLDFLQRNLNSIVVAKDLYFDDWEHPVAGTYTSDSIIIRNDGIHEHQTETSMLDTMHHEFSSLILHNYPRESKQLRRQWREANPSGYEYPDNSYDLLAKRESEIELSELNEQGFVSEYASSSFENDYNSMVGYAFGYRNFLLELMDDYPRIREKFLLLVSFFNEVGAGVEFSGYDLEH